MLLHGGKQAVLMVESEPGPARVALGVSTRGVLLGLWGVAALLGLLSGVGRLLRWYAWAPDTAGARLAQMFDVNLENNVPAYYSSVLLLSCAPLLLYICAHSRRAGDRRAWYWLGLALIFLGLSLDEAIELHGRLNAPVAEHLGTGGLTSFGWTIPAIVIVVFLGAAYARFLLSLPRRVGIILAASGALYVAGAVGLELVAGFLVSEHFQASANRTYALATLSEHLKEMLEMSGVSLFLYGLLRYIRDEMKGVLLVVRLD